jgi:hypothetical protein
VSSYEAMALEIEDVFAVLSELQQPEYELALLVVGCQLRISEALGLKWKDVLWERGLVAIRQTFVHLNIQEGAKTKLKHQSCCWMSWPHAKAKPCTPMTRITSSPLKSWTGLSPAQAHSWLKIISDPPQSEGVLSGLRMESLMTGTVKS